MTENAVPYVVMEHIHGLPLDEYCDSNRLGLNARLELFRQVCNAVQYAHRNLIVHRDIKPDNILVTEDGAPVLLDFGIAKLLRPDLLGLTNTCETQAGTQMMTPEFASPEQILGSAVTTASDIYSLGVLLYVLVTGKLPHPATGRSAVDLGRRIAEQEPIPPREVQPGIPSDVEAIILKALRKEPEARYHSAQDLAADIRRFVEGFPVRASEGNWRYHSAKFIRRHRIAVALGGSLVMVLLASTVTLGVLARSWRIERDSAEASTEFLVDLLQSADPNSPNSGQAIEVRSLLDEAARRLTRNTPPQEPRMRARLAEKLGDIYKQLGLYQPAQPLFELSIQLHKDLHGARSEEVARNLVRLADLQRERQQYDAAEATIKQSVEIRKQLHGPRHLSVADSLNMLGIVLQIRGRLDDSEAVFREALAIRGPGISKEFVSLRALSLGNLGNVLSQKGDLQGAAACFREALEIRKEAFGPEHPRVASSMGQLSQIALKQGRVDEAVALTAQALAIGRKHYRGDNPDLARILANHGNSLRDAKRYGESEALLREALAIQKKARGDRATEVSFVQGNLASALWDAGKPGDAVALMREALSIREERRGPTTISPGRRAQCSPR